MESRINLGVNTPRLIIFRQVTTVAVEELGGRWSYFRFWNVFSNRVKILMVLEDKNYTEDGPWVDMVALKSNYSARLTKLVDTVSSNVICVSYLCKTYTPFFTRGYFTIVAGNYKTYAQNQTTIKQTLPMSFAELKSENSVHQHWEDLVLAESSHMTITGRILGKQCFKFLPVFSEASRGTI